MDYDNTNSGVLFQNDKDGNEKRPDYKGKLNVNGKDFWISGWKKLSKDNKPYLSLSIQEPQQHSGYDKAKAVAQQVKAKADTVHDVSDEPINLDDIPF